MSSEESGVVSAVPFEKTCTLQSSPPRARSKRRCDEVKCELVDYDSLPDYLKDNEFILGYYRCEWPLKETILSIFSIHNETLNVWTHLIGFFIFVSLTVFTAMLMPRKMGIPFSTARTSPLPSPMLEDGLQSSLFSTDVLLQSSSQRLAELLIKPKRLSDASNLTNSCFLRSSVREDAIHKVPPPRLMKPITRWPLFAFMGGAMFCLLTSSICHLILCHSKKTCYLMLRLDYIGIAALIVTSFYPVVYYSFICDPFFRNLYMGFITAFGVATILASLVPIFQAAQFRTARAALFFCMGVSGVVPIMHKVVAFSHRPEAIISAGYELLMGVFYGVGVVIYATRVPERWKPGWFDLVGHSHQLFHVLVIAGAYAHYLAGLVYLRWRDVEGC